MSSEDEDFEWEEVEATKVIVIEDEDDDAAGKSGLWKEDELEISVSVDKTNKKKKPATKEERAMQLAYHECMLLCLLAASVFRNQVANNVEIQARLVSLMPLPLLEDQDALDPQNTLRQKKKKVKTGHLPTKLEGILDWFRSTSSWTQDFQDYSLLSHLKKPDMLNGISKELTCIYFVSLLRSILPKLDARLVISLSTFPRTLRATRKLSANMYPMEYCVDVLVDDERICIDPTSGNTKEDVKWKETLYVIAIANSQSPPFFTVKDITRKFVERWSTVKSKRSELFWGECLWLFSPDKEKEQNKAEEKENKHLVSLEANEKIPTSLSGFKNHPLFVLERHLNVNQAIYPKEKEDAVGVFKDELVFPRKLVQTLFSAENWKRKGRMIPSMCAPYKTVHSEGKKKSVKQLFGEWQTVDWERPSLLEDGSIPTNDFGNIEIFHDLMIPLNCVHVPGDEARKAAQTMGIEFAKACVDFEHSRGRSFPLFNGVIVLEEHLPDLLATIKSKLESDREIERARKQTEILQRWKRIITSALLRERLKKDYT